MSFLARSSSRKVSAYLNASRTQGIRSFSVGGTPLRTVKDDDTVPQYDVLISGGGIVGSALACLLKSSPTASGLKVGVIESHPPRERENQGRGDEPDLRSYSITPSSQQLLSEIGVWDKIPQDKIAAFKDMQVWDSMGEGHIRFDSKEVGRSELGWCIEHTDLQTALFERMQELEGERKELQPLEIIAPAKVKHFHAPDDFQYCSEVILDNDDILKTRLIVGADGRESTIRSLSALGNWGWDYDQKALVCIVKTDSPNHTAWQRFFPTGPLALLPQRDGYSSIVWSMSDEMARELLSLPKEEFLSKLNAALFDPSEAPVPPEFPGLPILGDLIKNADGVAKMVMASAASADPMQQPPKPIEVGEKRFAFPLKMQHATRYTRLGVALVGDSAHAIHPLAGQGLNLGFADVKSLGNHILHGVETGQNIANENFLKIYDDDRKAANINMGIAMDGFKRLFGPQPEPVRMARNVGMGTLNAVEPVKSVIMQYAMGL